MSITPLFSTSAALSVKMSILLYLPGVLVILFQRQGLLSTLQHMLILVLSQAFLAFPFLRENAAAYLQSSFDLSRVFLFKWTVNWRFVDENVFLSPSWAKSLLIGHVSALVFFGLFVWCRSEGNAWNVLNRGLRRPTLPAGLTRLTPDYVATVLFTSNLIGILFARSLHYQFYSWYAQQLPFLAWRTRFPTVMKIALLLSIEYAWNVFPSTIKSSAVLLAGHVLLLGGILFGYPEGKSARSD
jgi:alpha-1,3-mannosyltransferase